MTLLINSLPHSNELLDIKSREEVENPSKNIGRLVRDALPWLTTFSGWKNATNASSRKFRLSQESCDDCLRTTFNQAETIRLHWESEYLPIQYGLARLRVLPLKILDGLIPASPINEQTVQYAEQFLNRIYHLTSSYSLEWVAPHISTEGEGEVTFEWWHDGRVVTFFVNPSGDIEYLCAWGPHIWDEMEERENPSDTELKDLWQWLFAN